MKKKIEIYADGACKGNPGRGGYGCILIYGPHKKELSGGFRCTTNNRMEILAAVRAFEALKEPCEADFYSDSQYLIKAINDKWLDNWVRRGWKKADKSPVLNRDLWERLLKAMEPHEIRFHWVKGHAENEYNNRCDEMAGAAAEDTGNLQEDTGMASEKS